MRRQTWIVNVLLIAAAAGLFVKLRGDWVAANQRYGRLNAAVAPKLGTTTAPGGAMTPVNLAASEAIVQNNLFTPDRNNTIPQPAQSTPPPPLPVFTGSINLGNGHPIALMVEANAQPGTPTRQLREGETIAGYKLAKVADSFVMVEYEGEQKRIDVQSAPRQTSAPASYVPEPRSVPAPTPGAVVNVAPSTPPKALPGNKSSTADPNNTRTSHDMFGQDGVDHYPEGTVVDGWKKVVRPSPFGSQVWWERVKQ